MRPLARAMRTARMPPKKPFEAWELGQRTRPVKIHNNIITMAAAECGRPKINHHRAEDKHYNNRGREFLSSAGHPGHNRTEHEGCIKSIAKNIAETDNCEHRHQSKRRHEIVGHDQHD